mmetsp:Transcript_47337/g.85292  ORF Transcript_47337/g.85292 Transcript_47337/m.85292 type:complete len:214 (+) Transcript_47337:438-1079(+)
MNPKFFTSSRFGLISSSLLSSAARSSSVMPRRLRMNSISFCLVTRSSLSLLMRFSSRIFHISYSSASFFSSSSSISSISERSSSSGLAASASTSSWIFSMTKLLESAFFSSLYSSFFLSASASSCSISSFIRTVSRAVLETNTGFIMIPLLGSFSSDSDSYSLASSSSSSSASSSNSALRTSSSIFRLCRARSLALSRRKARSSLSSSSEPLT